MKKIFHLSFGLLVVTALLFFMNNCVRPDGSNRSPNNPAPGFSVGNGGGPRTGFHSVDLGNTNSKDSPLYKSGYVVDNEKRWGAISAPITELESQEAFEDYRLGKVINNLDDITDLRVYVKLRKVKSKNYYKGDVRIVYQDFTYNSSRTAVSLFSASTSGSQHSQDSDARYNVWLEKSRKNAFHGFFEQNDGAIVLVIDEETLIVGNRDDDDPNPLYNGSIWFMNFRTTFRGANSCNNRDQVYVGDYKGNLLPLSERNKPCWSILSGPFDCRTWRNGDGVDTYRAIKPDGECYTELGKFTALDLLEAFNVSKLSSLFKIE